MFCGEAARRSTWPVLPSYLETLVVLHSDDVPAKKLTEHLDVSLAIDQLLVPLVIVEPKYRPLAYSRGSVQYDSGPLWDHLLTAYLAAKLVKNMHDDRQTATPPNRGSYYPRYGRPPQTSGWH